MALKPIPKLISIVLIVGAVGFGLTKFLPKESPKAEVSEQVQRTEQPVVVQEAPVRSESSALARANEATQRAQEAEAARAAVLPNSEPEPAPSVSNGGRGMDALMKAGKK